MKYIQFAILFFFSSILFSQRIVLQTTEGVYYKDKRLNDYLGVWEFNDGDDVLKLKISPHKLIVGKGEIAMDIVLVTHLYVKDKDTIHNSIYDFKGYHSRKQKISSGNLENDSKNVLLINFNDFTNKKRGTARVSFLNEDKTRIKWVLGKYEREQLDLGFTFDKPFIIPREGYSVPTEMLLTKQE